MAISTPTTVGSVNLNGNDYPVYGTQDRADEYIFGRLDTTAWDNAGFTGKGKGLVMARRWLDRQLWQGSLTVSSQVTAFPRTGLTDKEGNSVDSSTVPLGIEFAEYELALILLGDSSQFANSSTEDLTKRLKAGEVELELYRTIRSNKDQVFPDHVFKLVKDFLSGNVNTFSLYVGGLLEENNIVGLTDFHLNDGL